MNPNKDIIDELNELGSPLARYPRVNPFAVPEGYFDALPDASLDRIFAGEPAIPQHWPKQSPFYLPQGYFDGLARKLALIASAANEEDLQPLFPKTMPFTVPEGYFDTLSEEILALVTVPAQDLLAAPQTPFAVPEGYFAGFANKLMDRIRQEEEQVPEALQTAPLPQPEVSAPAAPRGRRIAFLPALRWAAAAALVIGIGLSTLPGFRKSGVDRPLKSAAVQHDIEGQLASLDKSAIADYVEQNIDEFDLETLETYAPASILNGRSAEQSLRQLDAEAIKDYLDASGDL